jgi:hypothetical protein
MIMKKLLIVCFVLFVTACSSAPVYREAKGDTPGYKEIVLSETDYRVQFKLRGNKRKAALDYALQRSAELTLEKGYDWFVVNKKTQRLVSNKDNFAANTPELVSTTRCGVLRCRKQTYRTEDSNNETEETYSLVLLDIHMGHGVRPEKESYDAQETLDRLVEKK